MSFSTTGFCLLTESHHCVTPYNETGTCVDIRSCPELYSFLRLFSTARWNPQIASFLRKSQCGFKNNSPYICCREVSNTSTTEKNSFQPTEITIQSGLFHRSPVNVSNRWSECGISTMKRTRDGNPKNAVPGEI